MKKDSSRLVRAVMYGSLALIILGFIGLAVFISLYNAADRTATLSHESVSGGVFECDDFSLAIKPRGGDAGAWNKDPILDENDVEVHGQSVGTIYEIFISNKTNDYISEWQLRLDVPELMWFNNNWNGTIEMHQTVGEEKRVSEVDLREYTRGQLDELDYYVDHTGPMVPMQPGDYFVYHPSAVDKEVPVPPSDLSGDELTTICVGFIVYVPDQTLDYVTDFSVGSVEYRMRDTMINHALFWVLLVALILWIMCEIIRIVTRQRVRQLVERKQRDAQIIEQSMSTFINFIEAKDQYTKGHSVRVAHYSRLIAQELGYCEDECTRVYYIALMHDCGKIAVPLDILGKPGTLSPEEYEEIKGHTTAGGELLAKFTSIDGIRMGALHHHERYDGQGYPAGIKGNDIPAVARIICVADSFDAMNSDRPYRKKLSQDAIVNELIVNRGKQFDPQMLDALLRLIESGRIEL